MSNIDISKINEELEIIKDVDEIMDFETIEKEVKEEMENIISKDLNTKNNEKNITFTIEDNDLDNLESDMFGSLELYIQDFYSEKERKKFIKNVESIVRKSVEYKLWRKFILETLGDNYCLFTHEVSGQVTIELHHHPFTLYEIVEILINKYIQEGKMFNSLIIAEEVLKLHFENKIGYIPLVKTLHEKYHNGFLEIPIEYIRGNFKTFYNLFHQFIDEDMKEKIKEKMSLTKDKCKDKDYVWIKNNNKNKGDI